MLRVEMHRLTTVLTVSEISRYSSLPSPSSSVKWASSSSCVNSIFTLIDLNLTGPSVFSKLICSLSKVNLELHQTSNVILDYLCSLTNKGLWLKGERYGEDWEGKAVLWSASWSVHLMPRGQDEQVGAGSRRRLGIFNVTVQSFFRIIIKFKKKKKIVAVGLCTACTIFSLIQGTRSCSVHSGTCRFASLSYPLHHSVHPNVNDIAVPPADMTPMMTLMSMMTLLWWWHCYVGPRRCWCAMPRLAWFTSPQ